MSSRGQATDVTVTDFVSGALAKHSAVHEVGVVRDGLLRLSRLDGKSSVDLGVLQVAWPSPALIESWISSNPGLDAIVNTGKGCHCPADSAAAARRSGVALLAMRDLMFALNGDDLLGYENRQMKYAMDTLSQHDRVESAEGFCEETIRLHRIGMADVDVVLVDIYALGVAEVVRTLREHSFANAILNINPYGNYSADAKARAKDANVGLFTYKELFGALRHEGSGFLDYVPGGNR